MTDLWVTSAVVVSWVIAAGLVGTIASFLVPRLSDRALAIRVARQRFGPNDVERLAIAEPGLQLAQAVG